MKKKSTQDNVVVNQIITDAAKEHRKVEITYAEKKDGIVKRTVAPYEFKGDKLYASCKQHGLQIHSFIKGRIINVQPVDEKFRPKWPVIIAGEKKEKGE